MTIMAGSKAGRPDTGVEAESLLVKTRAMTRERVRNKDRGKDRERQRQ